MRMRSLVHIQTLFRFRSTNSCVSDYAICTHSTKPQTLTVYLAQTKLQVVFFSFYLFFAYEFFVLYFCSIHFIVVGCWRLQPAVCLYVRWGQPVRTTFIAFVAKIFIAHLIRVAWKAIVNESYEELKVRSLDRVFFLLTEHSEVWINPSSVVMKLWKKPRFFSYFKNTVGDNVILLFN